MELPFVFGLIIQTITHYQITKRAIMSVFILAVSCGLFETCKRTRLATYWTLWNMKIASLVLTIPRASSRWVIKGFVLVDKNLTGLVANEHKTGAFKCSIRVQSTYGITKKFLSREGSAATA